MAYFTYDFLYGELFQCNDNIFRLHHILSVVGVLIAFTSPYSMSEMIGIESRFQDLVGIFIGEISNPFMQGRYIIVARGPDKGLYSLVNDALFVSSWMICR